jgi:hypothetical protein
MDLDRGKAVEANVCYRVEDGNLFLTVTASDANNTAPGPRSADPRPSYSIETVTSDDTVAEDNNVTPGEENDRSQKNGKNRRKEYRNKYEEYINMEGDAVPAKTFKVPTCRDQCYVALPNIEGIFEKYKNLGSCYKQNLYLQDLITVTGERIQ